MSTSSTFNLGLVNNRLGVLSDQIEELGPYNGLDSDSTAAALAAAQGIELNNKISELLRGAETATDANQLNTCGVYYCTTNTANAPTVSYYITLVLTRNTSELIQIFFGIVNSRIYYRIKNNGTFGEYIQLH